MLILQDDAYGTIPVEAGNPDFGMTFGNPGFVACVRAREVPAWGPLRSWCRRLNTLFGSVQLVAVPIDYSENTRVLIDELGEHA